MPNRQGRGLPFPNYRRVVTHRDPRLRQPVPAMQNPQQNADVVLENQVVTLNRAGTDARNPILKGLGFTLTEPLGINDTLRGLYIYQRGGAFGGNLARQAAVEAPGVWSYAFQVGNGQSQAGDKDTGAVRNIVRVQTAVGAYEKLFYAKDYEADVVTLNGDAALDPDTLEPVEIVAEIVDGSRDWLDVLTDFFVSWGDSFHVQNNRNDADTTAGFLKANGGAAFVSFFDTTPGTEGVGTAVNPLTDVSIDSRRKIQIENTAGLKEITARFRSKAGSSYFVDVPLKIRVIDIAETCFAPVSEPCTDLYIKAGQSTPTGLPSVASTPGEQVTAGPDTALEVPLLYVQIRGAAVGGMPKMRIRYWRWSASAPKLAGAALVLVDDEGEDYLPMVQASAGPAEASPYNSPHRYTVALSVLQLQSDNIAFVEATLVDGEKPSMPIMIPGPAARAVQFFPLGGTGGGPVCSLY